MSQGSESLATLLQVARARTAPDGTPLLEVCDQYRYAFELLEQADPSLCAAPKDYVLIASDYSWLRCADEQFDVPKGHMIRSLLALLFEERQRNPGAWLPVATVQKHLWQDERMVASAQSNRLNVMISRLRRLGLGQRLQRSRAGLRLDPAHGFVIGG